MRPTIGLTSNFGVNRDETPREQSYLLAGYTDGVFAAGGLPQPVPVPRDYDEHLLDELLAHCDGLILTGGFDLPPSLFGQSPHAKTIPLHERRARFEIDLLRRADQNRIPIFATCLGHQAAHVARGGRLIQHVDDLGLTPPVTHYLPKDVSAFHHVQIHPGSRLAQIVGNTRLEVNSRHHQIVDGECLGTGLRTVATSADGVVEASEDCDGRFLLTVQWHPEDLLDRPEHLRLFATLVQEAAAYRLCRSAPAGR
jgi:putative glutamine amidotransferase